MRSRRSPKMSEEWNLSMKLKKKRKPNPNQASSIKKKSTPSL